VPLRDITEKERSEHMLNISADLKAARNTRESLRRALFQGARKEDFHGFVEVEQGVCPPTLPRSFSRTC